MKSFKRKDRVRNQLLRDMQSVMESEINQNLNVMVTFTDVEMSDDLRYAKVYYSVLGDEDVKKRVASYMKNNRLRIQSQMGRLLAIKHTPEITFKFDPSIEQGIKIEKLLNEIKKDSDSSDE